jgi:hypothetical protein
LLTRHGATRACARAQVIQERAERDKRARLAFLQVDSNNDRRIDEARSAQRAVRSAPPAAPSGMRRIKP